jgi:hypothetical protein
VHMARARGLLPVHGSTHTQRHAGPGAGGPAGAGERYPRGS